MRALLSLMLWMSLAAHSSAQTRCVVCESLISGRFYWFSGGSLADKQPVCDSCANLQTRCAICKLPVKNRGHKLDDGRWLCRKDYEAGIFDQPAALRIFEGTRRDLQGILAGTGQLPNRNITVSLVDAAQLRKLNQSMPSDHQDHSLMGLTRTRVYPNKQYQHSIYLVTGLSQARLAAVCAHEYTHTWLYENVPAERAMGRDSIEGFCELVAYKLMTLRNEPVEKKIILDNAYSRGQVNAFVQAETANHFQRIVKWIKTGVDELLPQTDATPTLTVENEEPPTVSWPPPAPAPTPVPDELILKGIAVNRTRRYALINDCTLTKNEEGRVRVGSSNLVIRCIEIRSRSAIIQIKGCPEATELFLGAN
jgi:hypothetical protein